MGQVGSITSFQSGADDFRSTPIAKHIQRRLACLKGGLTHLVSKSSRRPPMLGEVELVFVAVSLKEAHHLEAAARQVDAFKQFAAAVADELRVEVVPLLVVVGICLLWFEFSFD
jgi:hypothetical protein